MPQISVMYVMLFVGGYDWRKFYVNVVYVWCKFVVIIILQSFFEHNTTITSSTICSISNARQDDGFDDRRFSNDAMDFGWMVRGADTLRALLLCNIQNYVFKDDCEIHIHIYTNIRHQHIRRNASFLEIDNYHATTQYNFFIIIYHIYK